MDSLPRQAAHSLLKLVKTRQNLQKELKQIGVGTDYYHSKLVELHKNEQLLKHFNDVLVKAL